MENKRNNIHLIYNALKSEGYTDIGSEDDFARKMQDEGNRKKVFSSLQTSGYSDVGRDYNSFSNLVYTAPKPVASNPTAPIPQFTPKQQPQRRTATAQQQTIKPTINIPTVPQMWEQSQKQAKEALTPMFEQEFSLDKKGNKVSKPKLEPTFDPKNGGIAAPPVYRDLMTGETYSQEEAKTDERVARGIKQASTTMPYDVKSANRKQVGDTSSQIDKELDASLSRDAKTQDENNYERLTTGNWFQRLGAALSMGNSGNALDAGGDKTMTANQMATGYHSNETFNFKAAQRSLKNAQRTIAEADHNAKSGSFGKWIESSFAGGAARGMGQKLFDLSTWDMGASDLADNGELMIALDKFDSGKPLSKSQQMLLDAKATELATDAYFGSYVGRGYKAGGVTAESIPFLIEFCLNPASTTGSLASNKMARYAVKRFGKEVVKNNAKKYVASKVATRVAGDVVGSAVMAATTGSLHTIADAEDRMNGQVQFGEKENGETEFSGHTKGVDAGTALGQAFVNQTIQNQSEMVGNYFAPALGVVGKGITKGLNKIGAGKVTKFMDDVAMSDVGRMVSDFEKQSQWNGSIGEYAEEVVGNVENAILVGDQTLDTKEGTGVFNLEQNIDTFLGVSLMGGFLSGVKTLGYRTPKYKAKKTMVNTSNNAAKIFGNDETWGGIRNTLSFGDEDDVKQTINDVLTNPDYNDEQKRAALEYAKSVETYKGMQRSEEKRRTDADTDPIQNDAETSYDNGYSLETDQEMNDAKNMLDFKSQQFKHIFGISEDEEIGSKFGDGVDALKQLDSDGMLDSEEKKKAAVDYLNAKATYDGMINHIQDDLDEKISASDTTIDGNANLDDGQIHPATMKLENRRVYVVGGNLVMNEDGTMIDADKSDESIIVRDADTGNIEFTDPRSFLSIDEAIDPAKEKEIAQQQIREQYAQQASDKIDGVLPFNIGDTYTLMDDSGTQHTYNILMDNGDGNVTVSIDGNEEQPFVVQKSVVQDMQENTSLSRLQQYEQDKAQQQIAEKQQQIAEKQQQEEASRPAYNLNDEIAINDENGNIVRGSVTANENDDGQIEVYSESPINGKKVNVFTRQELDAINANNEEIAQETPVSVQNPQEILQEEPVLAQNEKNEVNLPQSEKQPMPMVGEGEKNEVNLPQSEKQPMPMVGEGENAEPDFYNVDPKRARDYIYEETGLSRDEANEFVKANEEASAKALDKAKKSQPKIGTSISKYNKEKSEWQKKVDEAQRVAGYWKIVKDAQRSVYSQEESVRQQKQAEATEKAIEEDKQFRAEQAKKADEQALIGTNNVSPAIRDKWNNAPKIDGAANEIVVPNGEKVAGHYILAESGAASPSHNATAEFAKTEGFPIDDNDQSVNDRDYERDQDAQTITRGMAGNYDSRAMQTPVVVSNDGVVLSGNGRTMAGELAARDNTDGAYIEHLKKYPQKYGFTEEQVAGMQHPRVLFVPDDAMPYTSDTFSKFNQQEMKGQSKKEHAVKMSKIVDDATYNRIIRSINRYDTLGEFYADTSVSTEAIKDLHNAGAISSAQMTEMFDGDTISSQAKELLENVLIGKAFESNPDAIRQITEYKSMRQSIITALGEISNNQLLGEDYNLEDELAAAIDLVYHARNSGIKSGKPASVYARQGNLFQLDDGATVADYTNATVMMLADIINDNRVTLLKQYLALYNERSKISAVGQIDMFTGTVESKKDIIQSVNNFFKNATNSEQQKAIDKAVEQRKAEIVQQNGDSDSVDERPEETGKSETAEAIAEAEQSTETNPTDAQKEAGNYKKGHVKIGRYDITVENPKGSERSGKDASGTPWSITMQNTYGYIRGTEGVDGDHIDIFIADDCDAWNGRKIFVVDQYNEDDTFDEHKVMLGFNDIDEAESAYYANYSPDWKERHPANMVTAVNAEDFEKWIDSSKRKTKAFADYANVKTDHIADATKMVDKKDVGVSKTETTTSSKKNAGFSIDKRFHKKNGTYIYAVNFTERVDKEAFKELKSRVKDFGGYYSSFGKGGFIFDSEEDAKKFADAFMDKSGESIEDSKPLSLQDVQKATGEVESKQVKEEKEDLFQKAERISKEHTTEEKPKNEGALGLVSDERMAELKKRLRKKLGGQLNVGIDPEILVIGMELAAGHIDRGVKKFADFAKVMVDDLGDVIRPYLKAFYNGARDLPEITDNGLSAEMTPYDDVRTFDVANFDKETPNVLAKAEEITNEVVIDKQTSTARNELTNNRNQNRRKENEQTTADTEAITSETEIVANKAESDIETSTEENQLNKVVATIDKQVETVNKQLALLGYYEADENSPFNESYGYMRSAEKKAVKDADTLAKRLVEELGIDPETIVDKKGKKRKNIAQAKRAYESDWQRRKSKFDELTERKNKYYTLVKMNARDIKALELGGFAPDENGTYPSNVTVSVVRNNFHESQKTFDKPKEAGAYIHKLLALGKKVELSGFGMKAKIGVEEGEDGLFGKRTIDLDAPSGIKYSSALSEDDTAAGLAFRNVLNKVLTNKNTYERNLEDTIRQLDGADPKENVFPKQEELNKAVEEKKRLDEEYKKLSDEKDDNKSIEPTETEENNGDFSKDNNDIRYRTKVNFADGEKLPIHYDGESYSVDGVSSMFKDKDALLDAFRNKYENYVATLSDSGKNITVEPWSKYLKGTVGNVGIGEHVDRKTRHAQAAVESLANKLNLDKIEVITDTSNLTGKKKLSKGWYDTKTGKIVIVLPNHTSVSDVIRTLLHEGVAHHGLREMFGEHFDTFLDNVYANADFQIRKKIADMAAKNGWDFRTATEEYMASLAEDTDFGHEGTWWGKIKDFFIKMLAEAGIKLRIQLSDNELRYVLLRSYQNLVHSNERSLFNKAEDIAMQYNLKVGEYTAEVGKVSDVGEDSNGNILFRDGDPIEKDRVSVRDSYERELASSLYQFQEAMQDSMLGLKTLMDKIEKATGHKIADYENAYMTENAMSSKSKAEADVYKNMLMKPLIKTLSDLKKKGATQQEITDYMMAKHGLERNVAMAGRNAKTAFGEYQKTTPNGNKTLQDFIDSYRENDYAGLTALTGEKEVVDAELAAQQMVDSFESNFPTDELWKKTNACTKATLSKLYESGILDKDTYEGVRDMYENYIPLRGWDEKTSDEVYGYLTDKSGPMNGSIMKKAEGRKSKAGDPIATIATMAESGISQGNRNLMKQRFLNLVLNNPSDAVSVNSLWLKHNEITDEWNPVFPDNIEDNDTAAEVEQKVKDFEEKMEQLSESSPDMYKHGKDTVGIPYIVKDQNRREHQVLVKRNGRTYVLTINGNPRAAQALNGLSNPDVEMKGTIGNILKAGEYINRQMSAFYTTRNPNFIASNFIRDALYANSMVWVKEKPNYALRYHRNFGKVNPKRLKSLLSKHENGTLDMSKPIERLFHQFMMNGGETGYTVQRDIDKHKQAIKKELSVMGDNIPVRKAINILGEQFDDLNRSVENCARFAAFFTSRQMGRSIDRSIYDAKEISVNFNKKGSGAKFLGTNGQTKLGNIGAFVSGGGRIGYVFWNAAIQGTFNAGKAIKNHPAKGIGMLAATFLLGALVPALAGDGDGDDDKNYYNLPDFVRRSNICFRIGDKWITIPLSVEMRAMYGMGELATSVMSGNEKLSAGEISRKIAEQISQTLPLDFMEGDGSLSAMIPSSVKPLWEAHTNKDWTGLPLYKDTQFNKNMPEWTKAYNRTNKLMVKLSEESNRVSGGDKYTKGWADWNPAIIEHLLEGVFGGVTTTINQMVKTGETISGERDFDWRNIPIASRVVKNADERTQMRNVNEKYFKYVDEYNRTKQRINGYEEEADNGSLEYAEKIDFLNNSPEFRRYEIMEDYISDIKSLDEDIKDSESDEERKTYQDEQNELKKEMLEDIMESGGNK